MWLLSVKWAADDPTVVPTVWFPEGGSFTVTWLLAPTPTGAFQQYVAEIVAPNADTAARLAIGSTVANHQFTITKPQLEPGGAVTLAGALGTEPLGTEPLGGATTTSGSDVDLTPSPWRPREGSVVALVDRFAPRSLVVQYRVRAIAYGGLGAEWATVQVTSDWAASDPVILESDGNVWLQSAADQGLDWPFCGIGTDLPGTSVEDQVVYYAEGREDAIVVSGTVHSEDFPNVTLALQDDADRDALDLLRTRGGTLLLRLLYGDADGLEQAWVRLGAQLGRNHVGGYPEMNQTQLRVATFATTRVSEPTT
jgi:hypothetical protein